MFDFEKLPDEVPNPLTDPEPWNTDSVKRRINSIANEWYVTTAGAQILTRQAMQQDLWSRYWLFLEQHDGQHPKTDTMRQWARQVARDHGFHGSNAHKAGEKPGPLHEIPRRNVSEDDFERIRSRSTQPLGDRRQAPAWWDTRNPYGVPRCTRNVEPDGDYMLNTSDAAENLIEQQLERDDRTRSRNLDALIAAAVVRDLNRQSPYRDPHASILGGGFGLKRSPERN